MGFDDYTSLSFERSPSGVLTVWLDRPESRNATDRVMHGELARVWMAIGEDDETRAVLVRGADGAFSSGGDLDLVLPDRLPDARELPVLRLAHGVEATGRPECEAQDSVLGPVEVERRELGLVRVGRHDRDPTALRSPHRGPVAQLVEQGTFNPKVAGSIPARPIAAAAAAASASGRG